MDRKSHRQRKRFTVLLYNTYIQVISPYQNNMMIIILENTCGILLKRTAR